MANLDRITKVSVELRTAGLTEESFSTMLVLGEHIFSTSRVTSVSSPSELIDLGVSNTSQLYYAVRDAFAQIPSVSTVYVGRRMPANLKVTVDDPVSLTTAGEIYRVSLEKNVGGVISTVTFSYTTTGSEADTAAVATAFAAVINADPDMTAAAATDVITVTAPVTPALVSETSNVAVSFDASSEQVDVALSACRTAFDTFYGVIVASRVRGDQFTAAQWTESNEKLLGVATADPNAKSTGNTDNLLNDLRVNNFFRTYGYYSAAAAVNYVDAAIMSKKFTAQPGAETWANARLGGVPSDNLSDAEAGYVINSMNGNTFEPFRNISLTQSGKVGGGEWIDVIRFRDWLVEQIKINCTTPLIDNKVPFTDGGISVIAAALTKSLQIGQQVGGIAPDEVDANDPQTIIPGFIVNVPLSQSFTANEKASRKLTRLTFTARLAGAIHATEISGSLTYAFQ